jgi:calcium-translocating P-type ATPase
VTPKDVLSLVHHGGGHHGPTAGPPPAVDPRESVQALLRDLRARPSGLTHEEAERRLLQFGPNSLATRRGRTWPRELARQVTHPLALLLWVAAVLAWIAGIAVLAAAIVAVIVLNAALAFWQERQAERSVEALAAYLPPHAMVLRDGAPVRIDASEVVRGDILLLAEGDAVPADARLVEGALELDMSALTGESVPVVRTAGESDAEAQLLHVPDAVFRGTLCTGGGARAVVFATGFATEIGRIASLTGAVRQRESPLERQVRRVAWLIAAVAVGAGVAFLPIGLAAGLSLSAAAVFAIGLLVANVPEGLLPTITLALAAGVRGLARQGAVVKRLSAVETLGSATVICTDKTGTLTVNRMRVERFWTAADGVPRSAASGPAPGGSNAARDALADVLSRCTEASLDGAGAGDPTERALLAFAARGASDTGRTATRLAVHRFDPRLRRMTTVDLRDGVAHIATKGAPEALLPRCTRVWTGEPDEPPLTGRRRAAVETAVRELAGSGLRVLAVARRISTPAALAGADRDGVERDLTLVGLVGLLDPPRPAVAAAVETCHRAGIRVHVVSGDNPLTVAAVARSVGIGDDATPVLTGEQLARETDAELERVLDDRDVVFARTTPEDKLRIADLLSRRGDVVAMTGDGVNDAPALRRADIGVAMGASGTDVAREAATMVLTDDDFSTIVTAVEQGRRVYDNVRKFILYIFAHAVPEIIPFLLFALSGGAIPLPLTVLQILAIDLGTETLPALALGREPAEPGLMDRPPHRRSQGVIDRRLLLRAWGVLGVVSAALALLAFFSVLWRAGWTLGADVSAGAALHHAYVEATTATFAAIVACQVGTAFAARTDRVSLRTAGFATNPLLLWGILAELAFTAAVVYAPPLQRLLGTAALDLPTLALLAAFPPVVWGADEVYRWLGRRRRPRGTFASTPS